jgi:hypothetical protein
MPRLTSTVSAALADWWTLALDAAFKGYTATRLQQAAAYIADNLEIDLPFSTYTSLSVLYGYAKRMSNASDAVHSADEEDYIQAQHIAVPPWARDQQAMNTNPIHHVQYMFTYLDENGFAQTEYKTSVFEYPQQLPATIGELKDAITEDAQALADKYGKQLLTVDLHQILAV